MVRWLALSLLVLKLGPGAVDLVAHHAVPTVCLCSAGSGRICLVVDAKEARRQIAGGLAATAR